MLGKAPSRARGKRPFLKETNRGSSILLGILCVCIFTRGLVRSRGDGSHQERGNHHTTRRYFPVLYARAFPLFTKPTGTPSAGVRMMSQCIVRLQP